VTVATPSDSEHRPFGASRAIAGLLSFLLSLTVNLIVFLFAVFGSVAALTIMGVELALAVALATWYARERDSRASNIACAVWFGVASGVTPYLLWLGVAVLVNS
jgi:hypothetical protein